jgi:hypothetical protein
VELERLVGRLLAKDPAQRLDSAEEVCDFLEEINDRHFGDTPPSLGLDVTSEVQLYPHEGHRRRDHPPAFHLPPSLSRLRHQGRREGGAGLHHV